MITTKREVNIENGGTELKSRTVQRVAPAERIVSVPEVEVKPYSQRIESDARQREADEQPAVRISPQMDPGDLMPVIKSEPPKQEETHKVGLTSKAKVMLGVYAATAIILAMIVLATGLAINGASDQIVALENSVVAQSALLAESEATLRHLSDEDTITGEAVRRGMVRTESSTEVDLVELGAPESYAARSNAFDKFCDFLSGIIGG